MAKDINELKGKRAALVNDARTILDEAEKEKRSLTAEDEQKYNNIMADVDKMGEEIKREEQLQGLENQMKNNPGPGGYPQPKDDKKPTKLQATEEYKEAFWTSFRHGRQALGAQQYGILQEVKALATGTDTGGGYLVPESFEALLLQALQEENVMRSPGMATVITSSNDRNIPVVDSHGIAYWTDEEGSFTESDEKFGLKTLRAHKATTLIKVSEELLQDNVFNLETYIRNEFARRMAALEEASFINGDGVNKPKGIVVDAQVGKTAASATAITSDELIDLLHSVKRPYRRKAKFMALDASIKAIRKLKDSTNQYIWQPGLQAGEPDNLLGHQIIPSADMPSMAAGNKSIIFGDFSYYWISDRAGRMFQRLNELYAEKGQVGFRAWQRVDGMLTLAEAVKALKQA